MKAQDQFITLQEGARAKAVLAPGLGGWLLSYARNIPGLGYVDAIHFDQEVVDRYPTQMYAGNPILFPLVSYNLVRGHEHLYEWPINGPDSEPICFAMPQHGFARKSPWKVTASNETMVRMELRDTEETQRSYPFSFVFELQYELRQGRLHLTQRIENLSSRRMPFSVGIHPYFRVPFTSQGRRDQGLLHLPAGKRMTPQGKMERFTAEAAPAETLSINEDFSGTMFLAELSKREVKLEDPGSGLEATLNWEEAPDYRFLALWSKSTEDRFFCIEPWTALPNSFGRPEGELTLLEPGREFRAAMWIDLTQKEASS